MNLNPQNFLARFATSFTHPALATWQWEADDDIFGKSASWSVGASDVVDSQATVDLTAGQLQLTITERHADEETVVIFNALISFDDELIRIDGSEARIDDLGVRKVIEEFNERC